MGGALVYYYNNNNNNKTIDIKTEKVEEEQQSSADKYLNIEPINKTKLKEAIEYKQIVTDLITSFVEEYPIWNGKLNWTMKLARVLLNST